MAGESNDKGDTVELDHGFGSYQPRGLIVELFGPAACGKTTLGQALEKVLKVRGVPVRLEASLRPREYSSTEAHPFIGLTAPLSRASKIFAALGTATTGVKTNPLVREMFQALPPKEWLGSIRAKHYLKNLCRSWDAANASKDVVVFDQGFVNALCSMVLYSGFVDRQVIGHAVSLLPPPDVLVRVDTPPDILAGRLARRLQRQGAVERLFERKIEIALQQVEIFSCLDEALLEQGRSFLRVCWQDDKGLEKAVGTIVDEVSRKKEGRRGFA